MKKNIILILSVLMILLPTLAACGEKTGNDTTKPTVDTTGVGESEYRVEIPDVDMKQKTFTFLTNTWYSYEPLNFTDIAPEDLVSDLLEFEAYKRKTRVEDLLNCVIKEFNGGTFQEAYSSFTKDQDSGDGEFDFYFCRGQEYAATILSEKLTELSEVPYIDINKPWWDKAAYDNLSIAGKHYGIIGDITTNHMLSVWNVCFNKGMFNDFDLENPYDLVKEGKWTFDKMIEMSKKVANPLGSETMDVNSRWGINYTHNTVLGVLNACGVKFAESDSDGIPQLTINSEKSVDRMMDIMEKLYDRTHAVDILNDSDSKIKEKGGDIFMQNQTLINVTAIHELAKLRNSDYDFGILPYPKYLESEELHSYTAAQFTSILCVPIQNSDLENSGILLEAFAADGYFNVRPAFYERVLIGKGTRDEESGEILDYIFGNLAYDIGALFNIGVMKVTATAKTYDSKGISTLIAANIDTWKKDLNDLVSAVE